MSKIKAAYAALALLIAAALPASAVSISVTDIGSTITETITVSSDIVSIDLVNDTGSVILLSDLSLGATGMATNVTSLLFGLTTPDTPFASIMTFGSIAIAFDTSLADITLGLGDTFSVFFTSSGPVAVSLGASVNAIPLPASALLLLVGVGGLVAARRRTLA